MKFGLSDIRIQILLTEEVIGYQNRFLPTEEVIGYQNRFKEFYNESVVNF